MARSGRAESATSGGRSKNKGWKGRVLHAHPELARLLAAEHAREVLQSRPRAAVNAAVPGVRAPVTKSAVRSGGDKAARYRGTETQHGGE